MASNQPFLRIGQPVLVPISLTSANTKFEIRGKYPDVPDLTFYFWNPNPFDCTLDGTPMNGDSMPTTLLATTPATGYPCPARSQTGVYTSKRPVWVSACAFPTPEQLDYMGPGFNWSNRFLWLIYGTGK